MNNRYYINDLGINKTNLNCTVEVIKNYLKQKNSHYICVLNSRAAYHAIKNPDYCIIQNNSLLTIPDGKPLEIIGFLQGYKDVKKTSGSDLFNKICEISKNENYSHFFYGSTAEIIDCMTRNLKKKYNYLDIKGAISPPFGTPEELVNEKIIKDINNANPEFLWLGLGAPKQEKVAHLLRTKLNQTIIIGIGLVFEYEAGKIRRAPLFFQKAGFEWLFRLIQQPENIPRAILPLSWILKIIIITIFTKIHNSILSLVKVN